MNRKAENDWHPYYLELEGISQNQCHENEKRQNKLNKIKNAPYPADRTLCLKVDNEEIQERIKKCKNQGDT